MVELPAYGPSRRGSLELEPDWGEGEGAACGVDDWTLLVRLQVVVNMVRLAAKEARMPMRTARGALECIVPDDAWM